jgi:large subunit ribosomal protein L13
MADQVIINAKGKSPGRVATEVVRALTGKDTPAWRPNKLPENRRVLVTNAAHVSFSPIRGETKIYYRHSGYPGSLKEETLDELMERKPEEVVRRAVFGMLPKNKLRAQALKRLTVVAEEAGN